MMNYMMTKLAVFPSFDQAIAIYVQSVYFILFGTLVLQLKAAVHDWTAYQVTKIRRLGSYAENLDFIGP